MAKSNKPKTQYDLTLLGIDVKFENVKYVIKPANYKVAPHMWIERTGEQVLVMITEGFLFPFTEDQVLNAMIVRNDQLDKPQELHVANKVKLYTQYSVIKGGDCDKWFYYLDEVKSGELRVVHSTNFFENGIEHKDLLGYEVRRYTNV